MDTERDRRDRMGGAALAAAVLVSTLAGCTADDAVATDLPLDRATGAVLADAADRLAAALEAGDDCGALAEAEAFEQRARAADDGGLAPSAVVAEAVRVVGISTAALTCEAGEDHTTASPEPTTDGASDGAAATASEDEPTEVDEVRTATASEPSAPAPATATTPAGGGSSTSASGDERDAPPRGRDANRGRGEGAGGRGEGRGRG